MKFFDFGAFQKIRKLLGPVKRMAKKKEWPIFMANGHLAIHHYQDSISGEWPVTIKSEYSDTKKSRAKLGLGWNQS